MKKFLVIFCATILVSNASYATGFFIGGDALYANSRHEVKESSSAFGPEEGAVEKADQTSYGANIGFRGDVLFLLGSVEAFYDNLNLSTKAFESPILTSDKLKISDRYGAKVNAGFAILPRVTPFVTIGLANVQYKVLNPSLGTKDSDDKMAPLYGVGLLVDLPLGISLKAAYDYQQLSIRTSDTNAKIRNHLGVARIGVVYNF